MALLSALEKRRAYRGMTKETVDKETLTRLAEAARLAPSSGNKQPWRIVTVVDPEQLKSLGTALTDGNYWALHAPVLTAFVTNSSWSNVMGKREYASFELGMAAMAYQLQAVEEGLLVHPMSGFNEAKAKEVLGINDDESVFVLVAVGVKGDTSYLGEKHLAQETSPRNRKDLKEIFAFDSWNENLYPSA
ncbi:MAG: nitroreductase family protein [Sphaerochaetaceae bacterium]